MKIIPLLLFVAVLFSSCTPKLAPFGTETGQFKASFDHYAINVDDLDASIAFYQRVFGLAEIYDGTEQEHIRWLSLGEGMALHVIESDRSQVKMQKGIHMAIAMEEFDAFVDHLRKIDVPFENWPGKALSTNDRPDGVKQVYLQDPDGYWIEINDGRLGWMKGRVRP